MYEKWGSEEPAGPPDLEREDELQICPIKGRIVELVLDGDALQMDYAPITRREYPDTPDK